MTYSSRGLVEQVDYELPGASQPSRTNYALTYNGGIANVSSEYSSSFSRWRAIDGDRTGENWGSSGGWNDATLGSYPDWLEIEFSGSKTIDEINVVTLQDNYTSGAEPTETTTFSNEGITNFSVEYWNGSGWSTVPNGSVSGNNKVWRKFEFSPITTEKIRVVVTGSLAGYSRIVEVEAWGPQVGPPIDTGAIFTYDAMGNRVSMTDSFGSVVYEYDELSRITAETRQFTDTLTDAPLPQNKFKLEYEYHLSGALKSLTDPYGEVFDYEYDKVGRLDTVTGSNFGGVTSYATNAGYRAWGALKELSYGNGVAMNTTFNDRLLPDHYELTNGATAIIKKNYDYLEDGRLRYLQDELNDKFDRLNIYDNVGRIKEAKTGAEARGGTVTTNQDTDLPYRQSFGFDAFSNMTTRNNLHWGVDTWYGQSNNLSYDYENNRITNTGWQYDADGRVTATAAPDDPATSVYDARGQMIRRTSGGGGNGSSNAQRFFDGDGREIKRTRMAFVEDPNMNDWPYGTWTEADPVYYIRSTVMGGSVVSETGPTGKKKKTHVMAPGAKIATQSQYTVNGNVTKSVAFEHFDASGMSFRSTTSSGVAVSGDGQYEGAPAEMDPMGGNAGLSTPYIQLDPAPPPDQEYPYFQVHGDDMMIVNGQRVPCTFYGFTIGCSEARNMLENGSGLPARLDRLQGLPGFSFTSHGLGLFSLTLPDFFTNNTGHIWPQPHGTRAEGWRIFEGGTSLVSWGSHPNAQRQTREGPRLGPGVPINLKDLVLELANYEKCGEVFEQLVMTANKKYKNWKARAEKNGQSLIGAMFDSLKSINISPRLSAEGTNAGGHVQMGDYNTDPRGLIFAYQRFALITIQETIHQVFTDRQLRRASQRLYESGNLDPSIKSVVDVLIQNSRNGKLYEHHILSAACSISDVEMKELWNNSISLPFSQSNSEPY